MTDTTATTSEPAARPASVGGTRGRGIAVAVLWAGAAVLSLVAAYGTVYSVRYSVDKQDNRYTVDAWGHYAGAGAGAFPQAGARYGVILIVCVIAFALLALVTLGRTFELPSGPRLDLAVTGGGFGAAGLLAGTLVALYLQTDSILGNIGDRVRAGASLGAPVTQFATSVGATPFLALGGLACGVLALAGTYWGRIAATETVRGPADETVAETVTETADETVVES